MSTPSQKRRTDDEGKFLGFYKPPQYRVDGEPIPGLVARGVVPFRFLAMREDFATRFAGCADAADVRAVLSSEGFYG